MPTARPDTATIASGADLWAGRNPPLPSWLSAAAAGAWVQVPNGQPSSSAGLVPAVAGTMGNSGQAGMVNAYCGAFVHGGRFYIHGGGHSDYGGNEIGCIDLSAASPAWELLVERTPVADILGGSNYYNDGKPTSRHTYYGMHVVSIGGVPHMLRINNWMGMAFYGAGFGGSSDISTTAVDAFNLVTDTWLPAEYNFTTIPATGAESSMAQDAVTGDIWHWAGSTNRVWKVAATDFAVSSPADLAGTEGSGGALVFDSTNQRLVRFAGRGGATVAYYDVQLGAKVSPTLTGPDAAELSALSGSHHGWGVAHDTQRNVAWLRASVLSDSATDIAAGTMYRVRLTDWHVEKITPGGETPAADVQGIWGRMKYVAELDAIAYLPAWAAPMLVMRCY